MLPVLNLGPLAIQTPGLILLIGLGLGLYLMERQAAQYQVNGSLFGNIIFSSLIVGVIGARLAYVIQHSSAFAANPGSLFSLNLTMFSPAWGVVFGLFFSAFYGWRKKLPLKPALDAITSALAVFAIAIHLANLASGNAYGTSTSLPWGIDLWGARRHPVQVYEGLAAIFILWLVWPRPGWYRVAGQHFLAFLALSAGARVFLDAFRGDSTWWGGFRSAQVIAWLVLAICLWALNRSSQCHDSARIGK